MFDKAWRDAINKDLEELSIYKRRTNNEHAERGHTPSPLPTHSARGRSQEIFGKKEMDDNVNQPMHYRQHYLEVIDAIKGLQSKDEFQGYLRGSIIKYLGRYRYKGQPVEDLRKAKWYLEKLLKEIAEDGRPYTDTD